MRADPDAQRSHASALSAGLVRGEDGLARCSWCQASPLYQQYHDEEWGFPETDDRALFEKLCLEGFQAGLSWLTILNKREGFRDAFANFDPALVANFDAADIRRLVGDASIVRHRGKIESTVNNARRTLELQNEFGSLCTYAWLFEPERATTSMTLAQMRERGPAAEALQLSADLKHRGWTFVGPTTMYAFMQAMGLVNDHLDGCAARTPARNARRALES